MVFQGFIFIFLLVEYLDILDIMITGFRYKSTTFTCSQELVTLSSDPLLKSPEISNAGRHLTAAEFHSALQGTGKCFFFLLIIYNMIRLFFCLIC